MIGGRVLDASAIVAFATQTSVHVEALAWTAVDLGVVLLVPTTAIAAALPELSAEDRSLLDVLLGLPVTVVDALDVNRARAVAELGDDLPAGHAAVCARDRGWPVVTGEPTRYRGFGGVEVEPL